MNEFSIEALSKDNLEAILDLTQQIQPNKSRTVLADFQRKMFAYDNYHCFGLLKNGELLALCSTWTSLRLYCGKQLELDNVIVNSAHQSKGYGALFMQLLEKWSIEQGYDTIELNAYSYNTRGHKFYYNQGYKILGFHFQKEL